MMMFDPEGVEGIEGCRFLQTFYPYGIISSTVQSRQHRYQSFPSRLWKSDSSTSYEIAAPLRNLTVVIQRSVLMP